MACGTTPRNNKPNAASDACRASHLLPPPFFLRLVQLCVSLEKRITRNELARAKHAGQPERFLDSEVELDEALKQARVLAAAPQLYPVIVAGGTLRSLLGLLSHDNADIAMDVVRLLAEMTDEDSLAAAQAAEGAADDGAEDSDGDEELVAGSGGDEGGVGARAAKRRRRDEERAGGRAATAAAGATALVEALRGDGGLDLLVQTLWRCDDAAAAGDSDGADGVYATLGLLENLLEFQPEIAVPLCLGNAPAAAAPAPTVGPRSFMAFLMSHVLPPPMAARSGAASGVGDSVSEVDAVRGYCCELLGVTLQAAPSTLAEPFGAGAYRRRGDADALDGVEGLLTTLAAWRKRPPVGSAGEEAASNVVDALCAALVSMQLIGVGWGHGSRGSGVRAFTRNAPLSPSSSPAAVTGQPGSLPRRGGLRAHRAIDQGRGAAAIRRPQDRFVRRHRQPRRLRGLCGRR